MSYTMADFRREYAVDKLTQMTPEQRREFLRSLLHERLEGLTPEEIAKYLEKLRSKPSASKGKPRRKT